MQSTYNQNKPQHFCCEMAKPTAINLLCHQILSRVYSWDTKIMFEIVHEGMQKNQNHDTIICSLEYMLNLVLMLWALFFSWQFFLCTYDLWNSDKYQSKNDVYQERRRC